jgi:LysM repeat protein
VIVTVELCEDNLPPQADANGPYDAMRGKGQAVVEFDGSNSSDQDGEIIRYEWDFGDGSDPETGEQVTHGYASTGQYEARLTVTDNCGDTDEDTAEVNIVGPTPPANETPVAGTPEAGTPEAGAPQPPAGAADGTVGWCYRVQYGDTMTGIAQRFGVALRDLAFVNGVNMNYFVIAGQGLFVPTGEITAGPNVYEVQAGDTLNGVAYQCGLTTVSLASTNGLNLNDGLTPGQVIMIPPWIYR